MSDIELEIEFENDSVEEETDNTPIPAAIMAKLNKVRNATLEPTMP
jgi:hypothetical protein